MFVDKGIKEAEEKLAKEVELQKISIKKDDIELIMQELEVSKEKAEKALRENKGDVVEALIYLIR
jgi:NACalpha-BTF3-like transcription factor